MKGYFRLKQKIIKELEHLSPKLYYHGIHHTLDVLNVCNQYIRRLRITGKDAKLLRIAALSHDMGFLTTYKNHESVGAEMVSKFMAQLDFPTNHIEQVKKMILVTNPNNSPKTPLEKIICDADLDYLGRKDFMHISHSLYKELKAYNLIENHQFWMKSQIEFLQKHEFQTSFAKKYRTPIKYKWLQILINDYERLITSPGLK